MASTPFLCGRCLDSRLVPGEHGGAAICAGPPHLAMNDASLTLWRAVRRMRPPYRLDPITIMVAQKLTLFSSTDPCPADFTDQTFIVLSPRQVASRIEELRAVWRVPVGSRKGKPAGYWIITDLEDCKEWLRTATAAPKTQLATIWKAARAAFPELANQQEFEFMTGIEAEPAEAVTA